MSKKKKITLIIVGFLILMGIGGIMAEQEEQKGLTQSTSNNTVVNEQVEITIEQKVQDNINAAVGKKTNTEKNRILELEVLGTEKENMKLILARLNADDNLTAGMIRRGILGDSTKVFKELFEMPETEEVALVWVLPLVDVYGNSEDEPVLKVRLTREIVNKINWDSFVNDNYSRISKEYWEHTAISK